MSLPTTPARSIARSAFSTPSTVQHGTSPQELTPRSKVKAMLAAIDDESESASDNVQKPKGPQRIALGPVAGNVSKTSVQKTLGNESNYGEGEEEEEEEEVDGSIIPRGRLAAQLNGQSLKRFVFGSSNDVDGHEEPYTRVKKQILRKAAEKVHETTSSFEADAVTAKKTRSPVSSSGHQDSRTLLSDYAPSPSYSPIRRQRSSPGLFVTPESASGSYKSPEKAASNDGSGSDSDLPANPQTNSRFLELVARKRAEREAKQAEEGQKRAEKISKQRTFERQLSRDASSGSDEDGVAGKKWTQQSRPTRKASKKAVEEMSRETQRMSRNMQLTHQAKTKKKITKDSLFARFNFRTPAASCVEAPQNPSSSTAASSAPVSEMEDAPSKESPPTSPAGPDNTFMAPEEMAIDKEMTPMDAVLEPAALELDEMPTVNEVLTQSTLKLVKGRGKAVEEAKVSESLNSTLKRSRKTGFTQPPVKVHPQKPSLSNSRDVESDSDLEIIPVRKTKKPRKDIFDRLPDGKIQDVRSLQTLRALAHLNSPEKQRHSKRATISLADMQTSLQRRARRQALEERAAKIEDLKSRGIIVQTAEERQQDQADVEDLLEKARREGDEIKQKEKRAAKKEKIANGEVDDLPDTSDEDDDYQAEGKGDEPEVEFSGSEEEQVDDAYEADELESEAEDKSNGDEAEDENMLNGEKPENSSLIDNEASEDGDNEDEEEGIVDDGTGSEDEPPEYFNHRPRRSKMLIVDDDDEDEDNTQDTLNGNVVQEPAIEIPMFPLGLESSNLIGVPMGMTQAFAATMANSQEHADEVDDEQESLAFLGPPPEPNFPIFDVNDSPEMIQDSQTGPPVPYTNTDQGTDPCKEVELDFLQSQIRYNALGDTQGPPTATQVSEIPDPTQDVGFTLSSPAPERFISGPPSTVDTVLLSGAASNESPVKKKRLRLQSGARILDDASNAGKIYLTNANQTAGQSAPANAFEAMTKARERDLSANMVFDKKKSVAKTMVEEQAQESDDEYAGIGGASDDESGGEDDEFVTEMIDQGEVNVDENQLAAFYANKERASDEKAVEKLFKDINSGMLRRKRGAEFDLSDSDDDDKARQRRKRREFAKMRKALLENENVGKIAEDPKKLAFLRAIEDREDDDNIDFLDRPADDLFCVEMDTQEGPDSQSQKPTLPGPLPNKRKRPLQESIPDKGNMRRPAAARRTTAPKKPATLAEIRESVSFLIEEPGSINVASDHSSSASEDEAHHSETGGSNPRRRPNPNPIIDRLSLKRAESASTSSSSRLAFHDPSSNSTIGGFKVPSLLRRATTSSLNTNAADANGISTAAATERAAGGGEKGDFVRRGGTKRSSVNYFSREAEKRGVVEAVERRRKEEREKESRKRRSGLGSLGVGAFE